MYFTDTPPRQLSLNERLHIIDRLAEGGVTYISLLGGEPLTLGDELFALLRRAQEHKIKVGIVTNGQLLDSYTSERLIEYGLANLTVSIESPSSVIHNNIRGRRTFERLIANLETFIRLREHEKSPKLTVNTVLSRPNRDTFSQMIKFCCDLGVDSWSALTLNHIGNAIEHLDSLVISKEEHTEVALEVGKLLQSPGFDIGDLEINFAIVCPLVWEYLSKKYNISLPQPELCCSASISLIYISPTGDVHLCDRVHNSAYTGSKLESETMRPMSLLKNNFEDIWNSKQFFEMFDFVKRAETYAGFDPCNHCKYLFDRTCNPCPLQSYKSSHIRFDECLKAESYLGDISHYDDGPRTPWEKLHKFERLPLTAFEPDAYERIINMYPTPIIGTRHVVQSDGDVLMMHPLSLELIRINYIGWEIYNKINGLLTTKEVVTSVVNFYREVSKAVDLRIDNDGLDEFSKEVVMPFIMVLHNKGFINFTESYDDKQYAVNQVVVPSKTNTRHVTS
jgi:radical SAM protein with 4Fe4S-binding SPASM domain